MATYAVGDLQGCADQLQRLLTAVRFGAGDKLWLLGDLINRGPANARVLELLMDIKSQCVAVLGNHDLHFLAAYYGGHSLSGADTMQDLLEDPRVDEYAQWLCGQKLLHIDEGHGDEGTGNEGARFVMAHAGIPHIWSLPQAAELAAEVESVLCGTHPQVPRQEFFQHMYGNKPDQWHAQLRGLGRVKLITNYFTRMRLIDEGGRLDFSHKGALADAPAGWTPWYELTAPRWAQEYPQFRLLFGHWASLDGRTGFDNLIALDTGCVYGRTLTAYCLDSGTRHKVAGAPYAA